MSVYKPLLDYAETLRESRQVWKIKSMHLENFIVFDFAVTPKDVIIIIFLMIHLNCIL